MSTISKIDPRVRRARADRKELRRGLRRVISFLQLQKPPPLERIALASITADALDNIANHPALTGARKGWLFADLIKLLETPNESSTAQPSAG